MTSHGRSKRCKTWRKHSLSRGRRIFKKGSKQFKGEKGSGCRWFPSQSAFEPQHRNVWRNCGILGNSGALWLLASASQDIVAFLFRRMSCVKDQLHCCPLSFSVIGVVESASSARMEKHELSEMGCNRRKQWRSSQNCVGGIEMEKYYYSVEEKNQGAVTLNVDLAKALEKEQLKVVRAWCIARRLPATNS